MMYTCSTLRSRDSNLPLVQYCSHRSVLEGNTTHPIAQRLITCHGGAFAALPRAWPGRAQHTGWSPPPVS
jgi:hypothetical protein